MLEDVVPGTDDTQCLVLPDYRLLSPSRPTLRAEESAFFMPSQLKVSNTTVSDHYAQTETRLR